MAWKFSTNLEKAGLKITELLKRKGFQAFWVGGVVRDHILKRSSDNLDIATDAKPDEVEKILDTAGIKHKAIGKKFGTILAIAGTLPVEVTTFRKEGWYSDKRHPDEVRFISDFKQDAKRRDFTVNALYFDPQAQEIFDPTSGIADIKRKILRFVGDPKKRIDEDHLRMLRAVRLAVQLGFKLESNSFAAIKTRAKLIQTVSGERIKAELDKILASTRRVGGIKLLDKTGLLRFIIPEFEQLKNVIHGSKEYHLEGDVFIHSLLAVESLKQPDLRLVYAVLLHDVGKIVKPTKRLKPEGWVWSFHGHDQKSVEIFQKLAKDLKFSRKDRELIEWLIKNHDAWKNFLQMRPEKQVRLAAHPHFPFLLELWRADLAGNQRKDSKDEGSIRQIKAQALAKKLLLVVARTETLASVLATGKKIMEHAGIKPGPQVGKLIERVKAQIILGKIKNEKDLSAFLR
ncbi:MAG TPA: CCA tRNA nucleotidyltransferase [Patescibacteria group bacterium]|jgi:poly(A) polymerase|nr:CCA tRNA nucleotidyltransferase [Patescibacteria group bacterium]